MSIAIGNDGGTWEENGLTAQHTAPIPDATLYLICLNDKFEGVCE